MTGRTIAGQVARLHSSGFIGGRLIVSLVFRIALSVISAGLAGLIASSFCALLALPLASTLKGMPHRGLPVNIADAPMFVGFAVVMFILCRDARGEYLKRD